MKPYNNAGTAIGMCDRDLDLQDIIATVGLIKSSSLNGCSNQSKT
jgi:hypothetical protein